MQLMYQWYMSRQVRREERGPGGVGGPLRQRERPLRIDVDALRVSARGAWQRNDAAAIEISRHLVPEDVRQLRHLRVEPAPDQDVGEVDAGRADVDDGLAVGLRHVLEREVAAD